ncbi:hypothetical protein [Mesorhizobium sp. WSM1293]|uniref:hypothetical protein n=1 Tax=Mesorhizobium sp. WSM1293 TaxID=1040984 RepID=UPI000484E47E|nr:hypothetical protein [Mesorhizobium sp. WSM1293]
MSPDEKKAVIAAFVALKMLHDNAPTPAFKRVAARGAGNCLHALGIPEFGGIAAEPPEGAIVEIGPGQRMLP